MRPMTQRAGDDALRQAPDTLSLVVCPRCGRTDRFVPLKTTGKHYTLGKLCLGTPEVVRYRKGNRGDA